MNFGSDIASLPSSPLKKWPPSKRSIIIGAVVVIVIIVLAFVAYTSTRPKGEAPDGITSLILGQTGVKVKTEYKNPFDRQNQYINPFSESKSPFTVLQ